MRPLIDREKRIVRFAAAGIAIYLVLFYGLGYFGKRHTEFNKLVNEANTLRQQVRPYQDKAATVKKLMEEFHLDPVKLNKATVVSDASAAIQNAAKSGGLQLGPVREAPAHGLGKALATLQLEATGQVPAAMKFLAGLNSLGFPVVVDSVQFTADNSRPGQTKMNLTIIVWDFDQQKGVPHA